MDIMFYSTIFVLSVVSGEALQLFFYERKVCINYFYLVSHTVNDHCISVLGP